MPLELIADRPGHAVLREYEDPPLAAGEVGSPRSSAR